MKTRVWLVLALIATLPPYAGTATGDEVPLSQVPPAVRATIEREVGNGRTEEIGRETDNGRTVYEVEFERDGRDHEIKIAEDGTVIERD